MFLMGLWTIRAEPSDDDDNNYNDNDNSDDDDLMALQFNSQNPET